MSDEEEFEEIERIVLGLDEPDFDLYDRVACLDMVKAHQLERKRRQFHSMGNLREGGGGTTVTGEMAPTLVLNFLGGFFWENSNFYKFLPTGKKFRKRGKHSWRVF